MPEVVAYEGRDGWLFLDGDSNRCVDQLTGRLAMSDDVQLAWRNELAARRDYLATQGIPLAFLIAPNKESVYADRLPASLVPAPVRPVDRLIAAVPEGVTCCYPLQALQAARAENDVYPRIDTHWNDRGTLVALRDLAAALRPRVAIDVPDAATCVFTTEIWNGDLGGKMVPPWTGEWYRGRVANPQARCVLDNGVINGAHMTVWENPASDGPRIVVLGDSFATNLLTWLAEVSRRVVFMHTTGLDVGLVAAEQPDLVLWEIVERFVVYPPVPMAGFSFDVLLEAKLARADAGEREASYQRLTAVRDEDLTEPRDRAWRRRMLDACGRSLALATAA